MYISTDFSYRLRLAYDTSPGSMFVFNVLPARTRHQRPVAETIQLQGGQVVQRVTDSASATRFVHVAADSNRLELELDTRVNVQPRLLDALDLRMIGGAGLSIAPEAFKYLLPSRYCQSDQMHAFVQAEFARFTDPFERAQAISDWVNRHMTFKPGTTTWQTSASECLASRVGVCRDFAHLMVALCRACNLPARYVTGVDYGCHVGPSDFHAFVEVLIKDTWLTFDPTGLCPRTGLMRIGTGRDAADVAFCSIFGTARMVSMKVEVAALDRGEAHLRACDAQAAALSSAKLDELALIGRSWQDAVSVGEPALVHSERFDSQTGRWHDSFASHGRSEGAGENAGRTGATRPPAFASRYQ